MKLFVGLGNPGEKYVRNRHNVGFMAIERIAAAHGFGPWRKRFSGRVTDGEIAGRKVLLLKPETYMNEFGRSVGEAMRFHKIDEQDTVVLYDEIDLAPGRLKAKLGGGTAGHNGLRSLAAHIGNDYVRVRIGVGHPGHKDLVAGYVLHDFAKADAAWLDPLLDAIATSAGRLANGEVERFLTDVARKQQDDGKDRDAKASQTASAPAKAPPAAAGGHPAGEREAKRVSALRDNLRKWLARRKPEET